MSVLTGNLVRYYFNRENGEAKILAFSLNLISRLLGQKRFLGKI